MKSMHDRICRLEEVSLSATRQVASSPEAWTAVLLAKAGLTKEQALARHGSLSALAYALLTVPTDEQTNLGGLTPQDRYMRMLDGSRRGQGQ